jgi:hypothetical protein
MTKQNKVYAARTEREPYVITQQQKDAARERINKQKKLKGKQPVTHSN